MTTPYLDLTHDYQGNFIRYSPEKMRVYGYMEYEELEVLVLPNKIQ